MKIQKIHPHFKAMSDKELEALFRQKLAENPKWARRALLALYDEQTEEEQEDPTIHQSNGRGFSPNDQEFLTSLAQQARREETFSAKQLGWLHTLLPKYAKQLVKITRRMEDLEQSFDKAIYLNQVSIDIVEKTMTGYTNPLNIDLRYIPDQIIIRNPNGETFYTFSNPEVVLEEGRAYLYTYQGLVDGFSWKFLLYVGEEQDDSPIYINVKRN